MKPGFTAFAFRMGRGIPEPIIASAVVDKGAIGFAGENVVEFRVSGAGGVVAASEVAGTPDKFDQNTPAHIYIIGTDNYDGLRRLYIVRAGRYPQIYAPFVAETPSGAVCHMGYKAEVASEFAGFSCHFDAAPAVAGEIEITLHSAKGSAYNSLLWREEMNGVQDTEYWYDPPLQLAPGDRLDLVYGPNGVLGTIFYIRKLR